MAWAGGRVIAVPAMYTSRSCPSCEHVSKNNRKTQAAFVSRSPTRRFSVWTIFLPILACLPEDKRKNTTLLARRCGHLFAR